jgi:hypothetical protein
MNMFFATPQGGVPFAVIDWGLLCVGRGAFDVASLCGRLSPENRARHERAWVERYHEALLAGGVRGYSFDDCWIDYRRSMLHWLGRIVGACLFQFQHQSGQEAPAGYRGERIPRLVAAVEHLKADELLP